MKKIEKKKRWYDYFYLVSLTYFILGFFNILSAWFGVITFMVPMIMAFVGLDKFFCNHICGRGQLFHLLGKEHKFSLNKPLPRFIISKKFRYGFLIFFSITFSTMIYKTYLVASGAKDLQEIVTLFWGFHFPWDFAYYSSVEPWVAQFAFGLYSVMFTSFLLGIIFMLIFRPRSWCVICPMGTMSQVICKARATIIKSKETAE